MNKEKNEERAIEIFGAYKDKTTVYFSSDGSAFFSESDCRNHAKTLADQSTQSIEREDAMPSEPDTDFDEVDEEENEALTEEQLAVLQKQEELKRLADDEANVPAEPVIEEAPVAEAPEAKVDDKPKAAKKSADNK